MRIRVLISAGIVAIMALSIMAAPRAKKSSAKKPVEKQITVTLVRWPYT
jgi:hypothetical protein